MIPRAGSLGSTTAPHIDLSSRVPTSPGAGAECNFFDSKSIQLAGKVKTYRTNGVLQEDRVRLRITRLTEKFSNSSNVRIQMFRWRAETGSPVEIDNNALDFHIEESSSSSYVSKISDSMKSLTIDDVVRIRSRNYISGTTAQEFFDRTNIVVLGVDYNWDALKIVVYDGATVLGQVDFLLPIFAADPNNYAFNHPDVLNQLHPFWSSRNSTGLSDSDWASRTNSYCF